MKTYNLLNRTSSKAKAELNRIIETHEKYKKSFFWKPSSSASGRRSNESRFSKLNPDCSFLTKNGILEVKMRYEESCKNVYYSISIDLDGKTKNITTLKNLLKQLNETKS